LPEKPFWYSNALVDSYLKLCIDLRLYLECSAIDLVSILFEQNEQ